MAAKQTKRTRAGRVGMYEKSFTYGGHSLYLAQPVDEQMLAVLCSMLTDAYRRGVEDHQAHVRQTMSDLLAGVKM